MFDIRDHSARLQRRDTIAQLIAGIGMAVCLVLLMAIVMGGQG